MIYFALLVMNSSMSPSGLFLGSSKPIFDLFFLCFGYWFKVRERSLSLLLKKRRGFCVFLEFQSE